MLKEVAFREKSPWWTYKALSQLRKEKYIERLPRGKNLSQELWTVTEHGFEVVLMDRDDIKEYRYRVHAPAHDYLATCLQLGELWHSNFEKTFFTEQMLATLAPRNFPEGFKDYKGHVPDGITLLHGGTKDAVIGYEVDLNLKEAERYSETKKYYENRVQPHLVVWLVRNTWIANRIVQELMRHEFNSQPELLLKRYAFVLVDDFKKSIWEATVFLGPMKGMSLRKLHTNLMQSLGKPAPNVSQKPLREIFFPKFESPQKSFGYEKNP
jgi:hypothetical protein